jgi:hypothetical protein
VEIRQSDRHHPRSEKLRTRPAIHCALDCPQAVDLTFRLTTTSGQVDGVTDGGDMTAKNAGKTGQEGETRMNGILDPLVEFPE